MVAAAVVVEVNGSGVQWQPWVDPELDVKSLSQLEAPRRWLKLSLCDDLARAGRVRGKLL